MLARQAFCLLFMEAPMTDEDAKRMEETLEKAVAAKENGRDTEAASLAAELIDLLKGHNFFKDTQHG